MKTINTYINEKLKITVKGKSEYTLFPIDLDELDNMVFKEISTNGENCSLNHIDTSKITDMSYLFDHSNFNGDISGWDVSNVTDMHCMFKNSEFNGDISNWDVSNVKDMAFMFNQSIFNQDISEWDVSKVENMESMFSAS